jgi:hypothetical protein
MNKWARHPKVGKDGLSLNEMETLSAQAGLPMEAGHVAMGGEIPMPSIALMKVGHYVAIVAAKDGAYELRDPVFGLDRWVSRGLLEHESSGIYLARATNEPTVGWTPVTALEASSVRGKGSVGGPHPPPPPCQQVSSGTCSTCYPGDGGSGGGACTGMPRPGIDLVAVALTLGDSPALNEPGYGPPLDFSINYHETMPDQPTYRAWGGLGTNWSDGWDSRASAMLNVVTGQLTYYIDARGGGVEVQAIPLKDGSSISSDADVEDLTVCDQFGKNCVPVWTLVSCSEITWTQSSGWK